MAAIVGTAGGAIEVLLLAVIKFGSLAQPIGRLALGADFSWRHGYLWVSPHVVWMAPLTLTIVCLGVALLQSVASRAWPAAGTWKASVIALAFVGFANLLVVYPRLYAWAVVVLAAGLGTAIARWAAARQARISTWMRSSWRWAVAGLGVVMIGMLTVSPVRERLRLNALSEPAPDSPNVLLLILDTVRAASVSAHGYARPTTPQLDALAMRGVAFDHAIATSSWTLPSHLSAFTGFLPYELTGTWLKPYEGERETLAERLRDAGYETAGFVANVVYLGHESGMDEGFIHYEDYDIASIGEFLLSSSLTRRLANARWVRRLVGYHDIINRKDAREVADDFLHWLGRDRDRPFYAMLNFLDAHEPYMPPAPFDRMFGDPSVRRNELNRHQLRLTVRLGRNEMTAAEVQAELDAYEGTIAYIDAQVGRILDALEARGLADNTIVIVTSDHGEHFGEHDLHLHGNSLYMPAIAVPLILAFGDNIPRSRIDAGVSIRDIPATVMDLAGLPNPFPGTTLRRYWAAPSPFRPTPLLSELTAIAGAPTWKSILLGQYHYIWHENSPEEVYDLAADPHEQQNLIRGVPPTLLTILRRALAPHVRNDSALWSRLPQHQEDVGRDPGER